MRCCKLWQQAKRSAMLSLAVGGLLIFSSNAFGQYGGPGGGYGGGSGGYGGGSGGPPYQPGWNGEPRPGTMGSSPGDFDWTGLNLYLDLTPWPGFPTVPQGHQTNYNPFGASQNIGRLSAWAEVTFTVNGTSTFKWLWHPPLTPATQSPDFSNFPAPALFTLGAVNMSVTGQGSDASIHVKGSVDPGGQDWMDSDPTPNSFDAGGPISITAAMSARAIVPAGSGNEAVAQMSPTLNGHGIAIPNTNSGRSTGDGSISLNVNRWGLYPILLASPYPFGLPQMGWSDNMFVYDYSFPTGILTLPMSAVVVGAVQEDTQWLVDQNKVGWTVHPSIDGWLGYSKIAQGDTIKPVSNGNGAVGVSQYAGLPDSDSGFGLKQVLLKVESHDSQQAYIQTFFSATGYNHPNYFLGGTPNWFYYYNKMFPAAPAVYEAGPQSHCDWGWPNGSPADIFPVVTGTYIDDDAFGQDQVRVFTPGSNFLQLDGMLFVAGIHNYLYTVGHELGHKWDIENGLFNPKFRESDSWNQGFDFDGDGVLNSAEEANNLNPRDPDTTGAFGGDIDGDSEVLACIHGLAMLVPQKDAWRRDWSSAGLQYGGLADPQWGPYNPAPEFANYWGRPTQAPYFPWDYERATTGSGRIYYSGQHDPDPPGNAVTQVKNPFANPYNGGITYPGRHIP